MPIISSEIVRVAEDPKASTSSTVISNQDAKFFYNEVEDLFNENAGILHVAGANAKLFNELTSAEKAEQIQKFLETKIAARDVDQTDFTQPVCP